MAAVHVAGYGVATWAGLEEESFTVGELLAPWPRKPREDSTTTCSRSNCR
ncbi:hypothetical protein GCM10010313_26930 [Streptomyces violarus]|uniref:Uncharacterized protein n=1 Tax=Streptomyces violarus TaxID=67380 RepID=A0A7W5F5R5_9ACTN|nr:hypothetical protein [Streptomyces violarus]GHD07596.1 hypothetical protein GCM10010313_26930 [Streptomyces violarus]